MFAKSQINIDLVTTEAFCLIPLPKQKKKKQQRAQVSILFFSAHKNLMMK